MAGPQPHTLITISAPQRAVLEALHRQATCPQALALRVRIILGAATGQSNTSLATQLACTRSTVRTWRSRWAAAQAQLALAETHSASLRQMIADVLADAPRSGAPATFSAEQIVAIVNLACTSPRALGRPVDAWTPRELADEAKRQRIVTSISPTSVGRFLGRSRSSTSSQPLLAQRQDQAG
jgi:putative transposase